MIEHRHKTEQGLQRATEVARRGERHRHGPHHGAWQTYTAWATEAGHPHGADPYASHAPAEAWTPAVVKPVELGGALQPAAA